MLKDHPKARSTQQVAFIKTTDPPIQPFKFHANNNNKKRWKKLFMMGLFKYNHFSVIKHACL